MKTFHKYILLFCTVISISGCEDYLDVQPESTLGINDFYSTTTEAEIALSGIYSVIASHDVYGVTMSIIMESGTDEGYYNRRFNENWTVGLYRHTASDEDIRNLWTKLYTAINLCNLFTEQLKKDSFTETEYNALMAEARFLRAHCYALLVSWFEEVPMPLASTKGQSDNNLEASSLETLYGQIIDDFTFAATYLPGKDTQIPGRATNLAANGLLARVYLKMAGYPLKDTSKYELARQQCDIIIQSGEYGLNTTNWTQQTNADGDQYVVVSKDGYRDHFLSYIQSNYDNQESLFEISYYRLREVGLVTDGRIGDTNGIPFALGGSAPGYPSAFAGYNTTSLLRDAYNKVGDTIRKAWNIASYRNTGSGDIVAVDEVQQVLTRNFVPAKFRRWEPTDYADLQTAGELEPYTILEQGTIAQNFTNINFPVLRYADVLLMYAEADNEVNNGPSANAKMYLDQVRNRAALPPIDVANPAATSSKEAFFNELVEERFRELCFEGLRKHDLIRWELLDDKLQLLESLIRNDPTFSPTNADHQAFLRSSQFFDVTKHLSLPYPLQEVQLNNLLNQKPNW